MEPSWDLTSLSKACISSFHVSYVVRLQLLISLQLPGGKGSLLFTAVVSNPWIVPGLERCSGSAHWLHRCVSDFHWVWTAEEDLSCVYLSCPVMRHILRLLPFLLPFNSRLPERIVFTATSTSLLLIHPSKLKTLAFEVSLGSHQWPSVNKSTEQFSVFVLVNLSAVCQCW